MRIGCRISLFPLIVLLAVLLQPTAFAAPVTAFYYTGSPVSFITQGKTATVTPADGYKFTAVFGAGSNGYSDYVYVQVNDFAVNQFWDIRFGAPTNQPSLNVGSYPNATNATYSTNPSLEFDGDSAANDKSTGFFHVLEITVSNGTVQAFAADFTQYDGGAEASWNYGSIRYNSSVPLNTLPPPPQQPLSMACTGLDGLLVPTITYSATCLAAGGTGPYQWSVAQGQLPGNVKGTASGASANTFTIFGPPVNVGPFTYTIQVEDSLNQTASQTLSGAVANMSCYPDGLSGALPPSQYFFPYGGSAGLSFTFRSTGCPWTLSSDIPGIRFLPASGVTSGFSSPVSAFMTVPPNTSVSPQAGNVFLKAGGKVELTYPVVVNSTACTYTVMPATAHFSAEGGAGVFTVTATPSGCYPYGTSAAPLNVTASSDSPGLYYYWMPPNAGAARTGTVQYASSIGAAVGAASFNWTQDAGDGSFVVGCYPPGPTKVRSPIVGCAAAGGVAPYSWSITEGVVPGGFNTSGVSGSSVTFGNPAVPGPYAFTVKVTDSGKPNAQVATYKAAGTILATAPVIGCSSTLGPTQVGVEYAVGCLPAFGTPPYQWAVISGTLPAGLALTPLDGGGVTISGAPSDADDYNYIIGLVDSSSPVAMSTSVQFSGTVVPSGSLPESFGIVCAVEETELGAAMMPIACSVSGGTPDYHWSIFSGELPPGMQLSSDTGSAITINGTPTQASYNGYFKFYLKVVDSSPTPQARMWTFDLLVANGPSFTCSPPPGQVGQPYSTTCYGFRSELWVSSGILPPGLSLSSSGISGIPTTPGTYDFTISQRDELYPSPVTASQSYSIVIGPTPPALNTSLISGSFAQLASGGGWESSTVLVNAGPNYASAHVGYLTDSGTVFSLPVEISPGDTAATVSTVDQILPLHSILTITSNASGDAPVQTGSAQLSSGGDVSGFIRFRYAPQDQDALVPLETRIASSYTLVFDNTAGTATGVAVVNLSSGISNIPVVIRDESGARIGSDSLSIPSMGHTAFILTDKFPLTANGGGTIEFDTPPNGRISILGLRFPPGGRFTTIPVVASSDPGGGALAHLAAGQGWMSTIELVNTGSTSASAHLQFFSDNGDPMPLSLNAGGVSTTSSVLDPTLSPYQHLEIQTASDGTALQTGSARLSASGNVGGFVRFGYVPQGEEAIVPLENRNALTYILPFDNTAGTSTGVAVASLGSAPISIPVVVRNTIGDQIGSATVALAGNGHSAFLLSDRILSTVNEMGTIEFDAPSNGGISVLGLRFNPSGAFSTIPVVAP